MPANFNTIFLKIVFLVFINLNLHAFDAFVSPVFLKNIMDDNNTVIIDVRSSAEYKKGHMQRAIHVSVDDFITYENNYYKINEQDFVSSKLQALGLKQQDNIFIYSKNDNTGIKNSTLVALILTRSGFNNIAILDGGYMAWVFENELLVSTEEFKLNDSKNKITPLKNRILVDKEYVENSTSSILLDARLPSEYYGIAKSPNLDKLGHIPHAKSAYYRYNFLHDGSLRDINDLYEIYSIGDELKSSDNIIVYGESIYDASVDWYILSKYLQYKHVKIYEGSLMDWQKNYENLPLIKYKWE